MWRGYDQLNLLEDLGSIPIGKNCIQIELHLASIGCMFITYSPTFATDFKILVKLLVMNIKR